MSTVDEEKDELRALYLARFGNRPIVTQAMLHKLLWLADKALELHTELRMHMVPVDRFTAKMIRTKGIEHRGLRLRVGSSYFSGREAYTFTTDGRVYFCGWASTENHRPFLTAFREWVTSI